MPEQNQHIIELVALYSVVNSLNANSGQAQILTEVLETLERDLGFRRCTIMLLSPDGNELAFEATSNNHIVKDHNKSYRIGEGVTGNVLRSSKPAVIERISDEPEFRFRIHKRHKDENIQTAFICVPIIIGSEAIGTLSANSPHRQNVTLNNAKRILSIVASIIAHDVHLKRKAKSKREKLERENIRLRGELESSKRPENFIGNSSSMKMLYHNINQVAPSNTTILIRGESGTGKELVASAIHYTSHRSKGPFIKVNCAALSKHLLESELFGHEKGSFTGALNKRIGRIEDAHNGTLFLDEIGEFPTTLQVKLLRVLQEKQFERVDSNETISVDIRIIAATNRDLEQAVSEGKLRQDMYYRINVFPIYIPPLRERKDDIVALADYFVDKFSKKMGKDINRISTSAINKMFAYHWPGNVRELENCIEHAVLLSNDGVIHGRNLPPSLQTPINDYLKKRGLLKTQIQQLERDIIIDSLKRNSGSVLKAAQELGITSRMIRYKIKNLNIDYHRFFTHKKSNNKYHTIY
ncbi:MAG: sigma 54-interacting transcriptional regulator [Sedimentisphaerales bacterium]|nr:sigma 54-interacting transcriptional regulator [Sedimentisphaerales bacterium]